MLIVRLLQWLSYSMKYIICGFFIELFTSIRTILSRSYGLTIFEILKTLV